MPREALYSERLGEANKGSLVSLDGVAVPEGCSEIEIEYEDLSDPDAGRSQDGTMWAGKMGTIRKLVCSWNALLPSSVAAIEKAVRNKNSVMVEFYDDGSGSYFTSAFYAGNRKTKKVTFFPGKERISLSFNLIEISPYQ